MKRLLIGGAALALAIPALAQVAPAPAPVPQRGLAPMAQKVHTRAEVQAQVAQHFARVDTNRDGVVTKAEADAAAQAFRGKFAEHRQGRRGDHDEHAFERLDTNRDGTISRAEWDAAKAQRQQRMGSRDRDGDGRPDSRRFGGHMRGKSGFGGHMFEMADANRDGRVTLAEAQSAALRHFDMMDLNRDGQVTPDERRQMRERMRAGHQHG